MSELFDTGQELADIALQIRNGQPVWLPRYSESSIGSVIDLFSNGKLQGFVHMDDQGADAYMYVPSKSEVGEMTATRINSEPMDYFAASHLLQQSVSSNPL